MLGSWWNADETGTVEQVLTYVLGSDSAQCVKQANSGERTEYRFSDLDATFINYCTILLFVYHVLLVLPYGA